jgi:hypothetical protein
MTARQVEDGATRLRELRVEACADLGLAAAAFGLALTASQVRPLLAGPLATGALAMTFLGMRAVVRRQFLVEDLAGEPQAYELPDVLRLGARAASLENRRLLAGSLRALADGTTAEVAERVALVRPELDKLVAALEDGRHPLRPAAAVAVERGVRECVAQLYAPSLPATEVRCRLRRLLGSFEG